jgi:hypothetical protein
MRCELWTHLDQLPPPQLDAPITERAIPRKPLKSGAIEQLR